MNYTLLGTDNLNSVFTWLFMFKNMKILKLLNQENELEVFINTNNQITIKIGDIDEVQYMPLEKEDIDFLIDELIRLKNLI